MRIFDPLYGEFEIPKEIEGIVNSPEFRRLSQVRLLNTVSPTLATLGELRRYSHTLGVIKLALHWSENAQHEFDTEEITAFLAAIVLHDVATPPFGHLMEYVLKANSGWDHESAILTLLKGWHSPENTAQQIFAGQNLTLFKVIEDNGINLDLLIEILSKKHPLSELILGKLDFDNIDNISRMAMSLGLPGASEVALGLAEKINVNIKGHLSFPKSSVALVDQWKDLRKEIYEILVFDMPTVAAQAVLSKLIKRALREDLIDESDWVLTDEQLLERLKELKDGSNLVNRCYLGNLPKLVFAMHINKTFFETFEMSPDEMNLLLEKISSEHGVSSPLAYTFIDKGAFSKKLSFFDNESQKSWSHGELSQGTVFYLFNVNQNELSKRQGSELITEVMNKLNISQDDIINIFDSRVSIEDGSQGKLDL